jgi:prepilin-type N-terminal cleavage/methylation domain-containing protein
MQKSGFTLLELSIVLVIIGLIIGGVMVGRELIRQSEIRSTLTDIDYYKTSIHAFRLKYNAYPGDMRNALSYWPSCTTADSLSTCNGNGNNSLDASATEQLLFWRHLSLSGIVPGNYRGNYDAGKLYSGQNVPEARAKNSAYLMRDSAIGIYGLGAAKRMHVGSFGTSGALTTSNVGYSVFTVLETSGIDNKIDDGIPNAGKLIGARGNGSSGTSCTSDDPWVEPYTGSTTVTYNLSNAGIDCIPIFVME